jgi:DNA mismatch endonuclease (patch repair protein)
MNKKVYLRDGRAPIPEKETTSRIMSAIKAKNTKPERILRKALWGLGLKGYRLHWKKVPGKPDIAFPGRRIAIFVNGCFWHRCPYCKPPQPKSHMDFWNNKFIKNLKRDKEKLILLKNAGWKTLVIWECQIKNDLTNSVKKIKRIVV